jgi:hypothetical protein
MGKDGNLLKRKEEERRKFNVDVGRKAATF